MERRKSRNYREMKSTASHSKLDVANYLYANTHDDADGCWIWNGPVGTVGYGQTKYRAASRGPESAHRLAFSTWVRPLCSGEYALHHCDKKLCINPDHLFPGTQADNVHDAISKGRFVNPPLKRGEDQHLHKLTVCNIRQIRERLAHGEGCKAISKDYHVVPATIWFIAIGRTWSWVS